MELLPARYLFLPGILIQYFLPCGTPTICLQTGWDDLGTIAMDNAKDIRSTLEAFRSVKLWGLGVTARQKVLDKYTWEKQIPSWKKFIDQSLALAR